MADENILAGMTAAQADEDIARREAKVAALEDNLRAAKDNLKAARAERKHLEEPRPATVRDVVEALKTTGGSAQVGDTVEAGAGAAEASGEVS